VLITQLPSQDALNSTVLGFSKKVPYVTIQAVQYIAIANCEKGNKALCTQFHEWESFLAQQQSFSQSHSIPPCVELQGSLP
jgi:hypothetical protein